MREHGGHADEHAPKRLVEADERHQEDDAQIAARVPHLAHPARDQRNNKSAQREQSVDNDKDNQGLYTVEAR